MKSLKKSIFLINCCFRLSYLAKIPQRYFVICFLKWNKHRCSFHHFITEWFDIYNHSKNLRRYSFLLNVELACFKVVGKLLYAHLWIWYEFFHHYMIIFFCSIYDSNLAIRFFSIRSLFTSFLWMFRYILRSCSPWIVLLYCVSISTSPDYFWWLMISDTAWYSLWCI